MARKLSTVQDKCKDVSSAKFSIQALPIECVPEATQGEGILDCSKNHLQLFGILRNKVIREGFEQGGTDSLKKRNEEAIPW